MSENNGRIKARDHRCKNCGRLLGRSHHEQSLYLEIRCPRCGAMYTSRSVSDLTLTEKSSKISN